MIVFVEVPQSVGVDITDLASMANRAKQAHEGRINGLNKLRELAYQGFEVTCIEDRSEGPLVVRIYTLECQGEPTQIDPESEPQPIDAPYGG